MADHPIQPSNSLSVWCVGLISLVAGSVIAFNHPYQKGGHTASDFAQAVPIHPAVIEQRRNDRKNQELEQASQRSTPIKISEQHPAKIAGLGLHSITLTERFLVPLSRFTIPLAAVHAFHRFALPIATSIFLVTFGIWSLTSVENRALSIVEPTA